MLISQFWNITVTSNEPHGMITSTCLSQVLVQYFGIIVTVKYFDKLIGITQVCLNNYNSIKDICYIYSNKINFIGNHHLSDH